MQISEILAFAVKRRATEVTLAENAVIQLVVDHQTQPLNLPPLKPNDYSALLGSVLDAARKDALGHKASGDFEFTIEGLATFRARVVPGKMTITLPPPPVKKPLLDRLFG